MPIPKQIINDAQLDERLRLIEYRAFELLKAIAPVADADAHAVKSVVFSNCYNMAKEFTEFCEKEREYAR